MMEVMPTGPKVIAIIQNMSGVQTPPAISSYLKSEAAGSLTKLIIKDLIHTNNKLPLSAELLTN